MTPQTNEDRGAAVLPSNTNTNKKDDKTEEVVDLYAPFTVDTLLEIRMGKMKPMPGLTIESGIDKTLCPPGKPVRVTKMGIVGDEHDPTFHGGVDKAVHGCKYFLFLFFICIACVLTHSLTHLHASPNHVLMFSCHLSHFHNLLHSRFYQIT